MRTAARTLCALSVIAALAWLAPIAQAEEIERTPEKTPILYVAVGPNATLFIHGTLHVPDTRITTLTTVEKAALDAVDELWTEVDFSSDVRAQLLPYVRLPRNRNLEKIMGEKLTARVSKILESRGKRLSSWEGFKPWMLDVYIGLLFAPKETATEKSIDEVLFAAAKARGKKTGGLESVYEQVSVFDMLKLKDQVELLEHTVTRLEKDMKRGTNSIETMIKIYLSGDAEELLTEIETYFDFDTKRDRDLYARMHDKRNVRFVERLETKAREAGGKMRFVALGAAHLPGKRGVLRLLQSQGYVVWRVKSKVDVPATREASLARALVELQRKNGELGFALRSLEQKVDRLQDRMDKSESRGASKVKRNCPPQPKRARCYPKVRRCYCPQPHYHHRTYRACSCRSYRAQRTYRPYRPHRRYRYSCRSRWV